MSEFATVRDLVFELFGSLPEQAHDPNRKQTRTGQRKKVSWNFSGVTGLCKGGNRYETCKNLLAYQTCCWKSENSARLELGPEKWVQKVSAVTKRRSVFFFRGEGNSQLSKNLSNCSGTLFEQSKNFKRAICKIRHLRIWTFLKTHVFVSMLQTCALKSPCF